jgi:hypothetical protein
MDRGSCPVANHSSRAGIPELQPDSTKLNQAPTLFF